MGRLNWRSWGQKLEAILIWLSVFLLPWQLRHTLAFAQIDGGYFEYGSWHVYASDLVILVLLIVGVILSGRRVLQPLKPAVGMPLLLVLVWMTISTFWAVDRAVAWATILHWWLFYCWCVLLVNRVKHIEQILWPLVIGATFQAGWGIVQYVVNHSLGLSWLGESVLDPKQPGVSVVELDGFRHLRAYGLMPHPNMLGGILISGIVGVLMLLKAQMLKWRWVALLVMGIVIAGGVAVSFSRMAWGLLAVLLLVSGVVAIWRKQGQKLITIGLILLAFVGALAVQREYVAVRFDLSARLEQQSVEERQLGFVEWQKIVSQYPNRGTGLGNYAGALAKIEPDQGAWWYAPVHNIYLLMMGELGAIGFAIWAWLLVAIGKMVWLRRREPELWEAAGLMGIWLGLGLTDHWLFSLQQGQLLFFLALTLIILTSRSMINGEQEG